MPRANLKHEQLADHLRAQLARGEFQPGDRLPSLAEMREQHGASRPTVERAHALLEKEGLVARRHSAGTFVRQAHKKSMHRVIGLSGRGFGVQSYSSYWSNLLGGIRDAAGRAEMQLLLLDPASIQGWEKVDGVLVCDWDDSRFPRRELPGLPVVSLLTPIEGIASVATEDYAGMQMATEHLLSLGHQKIGYLHSHTDHQVTHSRMAAYSETLKAAGIEPLPEWTCLIGGNYFYGTQFTLEAYTDMRRWITRSWPQTGCTALLCQNDETAVGAIQAFQEAGYQIPDDVSVMGYDGTDFCDVVTPKLSSIHVPLREIGEAGFELLHTQINADTVSEEHKIFSANLMQRATTTGPRSR